MSLSWLRRTDTGLIAVMTLSGTSEQVLESRLVPAGHGRALRVRAGQLVRVTDPYGGQVGDLFAFVDDGSRQLAAPLSAAHTRAHTQRLFPAVGQDFVTTERAPVLGLLEDRSPGVHDLLIPACDPERYRLLGVPQHRSCAVNVAEALAALNLSVPEVPQPVNLFMDIPVGADGTLRWLPARTCAGDSVTFVSHVDTVVVLSACPQDLAGINGATLSDLLLEVLIHP
jgi:uncharacterized protein YcgI (DUF1989 family)